MGWDSWMFSGIYSTPRSGNARSGHQFDIVIVFAGFWILCWFGLWISLSLNSLHLWIHMNANIGFTCSESASDTHSSVLMCRASCCFRGSLRRREDLTERGHSLQHFMTFSPPHASASSAHVGCGLWCAAQQWGHMFPFRPLPVRRGRPCVFLLVAGRSTATDREPGCDMCVAVYLLDGRPASPGSQTPVM